MFDQFMPSIINGCTIMVTAVCILRKHEVNRRATILKTCFTDSGIYLYVKGYEQKVPMFTIHVANNHQNDK